MGEEDLDRKFAITEEQKAELEEWVWHPPDLSVGGAWHAARIKSLEAAIAGRADSEQLRREGHAALATH
jgi:DNA-binding PadR family transcriptional regulator